MRIIIPMAGRGTRLRPHTLITPKPFIKIAGKSVVERLVRDIISMSEEPVTEIAFITGNFGKAIETPLLVLAKELNVKGVIYHQPEALGTAHAISCARKSLKGNIIIAFADTLFKANFKIDKNTKNIIFVKQVKDPSAYGVIEINKENEITDFYEKPTSFISDKAIIGIYYIKQGEVLSKQLDYIIKNNIKDKNEFQLTTVLENLKNQDVKFSPETVSLWLDCGNYKALLDTNQNILKKQNPNQQHENFVNTTIIPPVFIGNNVVIKNATIGPNVSIEENCKISACKLENVIIQSNTQMKNTTLKDSVVGQYANINNCKNKLSVGDYTEIY